MKKQYEQPEDKKSVPTMVAEKLIEQLRQGTAPWQRPWDKIPGGMPFNADSQKRYQGMNVLHLMMQKYGDPRWLTYKQAAAAGAQVRKGERGVPIVYWKCEEQRTLKDEDGKPVLDEQGKKLKETIKFERPRSFVSYVFNAEQIDGLPDLQIPRPEHKWKPEERAEEILKNSGAQIEHRRQSQAFYRPSTDSITLPEKSQFHSAEGYYGTALHELGHWTGHASRLNRDMGGGFGSRDYAKEELRAEIAAFMLGCEIGINPKIENHASYVESWIQVLREDPKEIYRAAADAEKILDYVMGLELKQEQKAIKEATLAADQQEAAIDQRGQREAAREIRPEAAPEAPERAPARAPQAEERRYINVPFAEKDQAKDLGARWDRKEGSWYIPQGLAEDGFEKWLKPKPEMSAASQDRVEFSETTEQKTPETGQKISREYLAVPYQDKNKAKAAGALWDCVAKSWYVGPNADMDKLEKWRPGKEPEQLPAMTPREEFAKTLQEFGCRLEGGHPIMDGKQHRLDVEGDKPGQKSGFYVGHLDGRPAGYVKNNRSGEETRWKSQGSPTLTAQDKKIFAERCDLHRRDQAQELADRHEVAAGRVWRQIEEMQPASVATPYLEAKGINAHKGVFVSADNKTTCIPAQDADGKIWIMQYIQEDGTKRFAKDSRKEGCFHVVGGMDTLAKAPALVISEGYATAASVSEALGCATIAAFDAGNLAHVAKTLHGKYPEKPIVIAGDNDRYLEKSPIGKNVGREKAELAAELVGGVAVFPLFPGRETGREFKDFNDLANKSRLGREGVARQLKPVLARACRIKEEELALNRQQTAIKSKSRQS